ncbi:DUF4870 domain-containing protein [Planctomycetota bacterium]|nr:DUF4870 domain-containing protein [Planctomycetota bacterium]
MNDEDTPAEPDISEPDITKDDKTFAMLCHMSAILTGFLGPLIIWLVKKDESEYVDYHGKEALNFALSAFIVFVSLCIGLIVLGVILDFVPVIRHFVFILGLIPFAFYVGVLLMLVLAGVKANEGMKYSYPFCLRLIK